MRTSTAPRASRLVQLQKREDRLRQVPEPPGPGKGGALPTCLSAPGSLWEVQQAQAGPGSRASTPVALPMPGVWGKIMSDVFLLLFSEAGPSGMPHQGQAFLGTRSTS